jgi:hypothetical protein
MPKNGKLFIIEGESGLTNHEIQGKAAVLFEIALRSTSALFIAPDEDNFVASSLRRTALDQEFLWLPSLSSIG